MFSIFQEQATIFDYEDPDYPSLPYPMSEEYFADKTKFEIVRILAVNIAYFIRKAQHSFNLLLL